jgi:hypothetical protein
MPSESAQANFNSLVGAQKAPTAESLLDPQSALLIKAGRRHAVQQQHQWHQQLKCLGECLWRLEHNQYDGHQDDTLTLIDLLRLCRTIHKLTPERSIRLQAKKTGMPRMAVQRSFGRLLDRRILTILKLGFGSRGTRWQVNLARLAAILEGTGGAFTITEYTYMDEEGKSMSPKLGQEVSPASTESTAVKQEKFLVPKVAAYSRLISTRFSVQHPIFTGRARAAAFYQRLDELGWTRARTRSEVRAGNQLVSLKLAGRRIRTETRKGRYRYYEAKRYEFTKLSSSLPEIEQ